MKLDQEQNKEFWEKRAEEFSSHQVSWWDINMKKIEINTISKLLSINDYILDVGCSNGATTQELAEISGAKFLGIDYSEKSIWQAKEKKSSNISFICKSVLDLDISDEFNKAISIRCLINLMDPNDQKKALENIYNALQPGGIYIMCETFSGALANLNRARDVFGLAPLPMPHHNNYFDEDELLTTIDGMFSVEQIIKHSSLYYIGTRIFQYMVMDTDPKDPDTELHRFFAQYDLETSRSGDFGPNKVYVLKKI